MKTTIAIAVALLAPCVSHAQPASGRDADGHAYVTVRAPAEVAAEYRERMKNALAAQPQIMAAILAKEFSKAGTIASDAFGAGMVKAKGAPKLAALMPEEMKALSRVMQAGAEEFAELSRKSDITQQDMLQAYTEKVLARCSVCHQVIRLDVAGLQDPVGRHARGPALPLPLAQGLVTSDATRGSLLATTLSGFSPGRQ